VKRRKKEEGRGKFGNEPGREFNGYKSEFRGLNQGRLSPLSIIPTLHSPLLPLSPSPISSVSRVKILAIKCFNYSGLVTKSSKKFMINPEKSVILVFKF